MARARTRKDKLLKELEEKKQAYEELEKDIGAHEDKLEALEQEALKEVTCPPGVSTVEAIAEMASKIQELIEIAEKQAAADSERKLPPAKRTKAEASAQPAEMDAASPVAVTTTEDDMEEVTEAAKPELQKELGGLIPGLKALMSKLADTGGSQQLQRQQ